ncbi:MAG: hypothetical protein R3290_08240 [Acidimicrobiia bacterium]|nr:hypothetical protein [Acidimicrobiia bacterium]
MAMSEEHKAALAQGRREARAIKGYLKAVSNRKPGRPPSPDRLKQKIADLTAKIEEETDPLKTVEYRQARIDAEQDLERLEAQADLEELEEGFVEVAKSFSERKGITYAAWREQGVPASVLKEAGIKRGSS